MYGPLNMLNGSNTHADSKNIFLRVTIQLLFEKNSFHTKYQIDIWYDMNFSNTYTTFAMSRARIAILILCSI